MKDLMKTCERNFDLVIYDTVPLNFADSLLLIPHTDGLLMVSRLGRVHREVLRQSIETLAVSKVNVLGLVVNMAADPQYAASAYNAFDAPLPDYARQRRIRQRRFPPLLCASRQGDLPT